MLNFWINILTGRCEFTLPSKRKKTSNGAHFFWRGSENFFETVNVLVFFFNSGTLIDFFWIFFFTSLLRCLNTYILTVKIYRSYNFFLVFSDKQEVFFLLCSSLKKKCALSEALSNKIGPNWPIGRAKTTVCPCILWWRSL